MVRGPAVGVRSIDSPRVARYGFVALLALLLVLAVGHLYAFQGLTSRVYGLPLWLWLELLVVAAMLLVAWFAVQLVAADTGAVE